MNDVSDMRAWHRTRIEHEDGLLGMRTNVFLVVNGLGAVAAGVSSNAVLLIGTIVLLANILWLCCALQSLLVIKALTREYRKTVKDPVDDTVRRALKSWPLHFRSTDILAVYVPIVVTGGWVIGLLAIKLS